MTLEQIKNEVANEHGFNNLLWNEKENQFINEVAKRYAIACVKASQEKIADNAKIMREYVPDFGNRATTKQIDKEVFYSTKDTFYQIDKESITNPDNIVLL